MTRFTMFVSKSEYCLQVRCVLPHGVLDVYDGMYHFESFHNPDNETKYVEAHLKSHWWEHIKSLSGLKEL